MCLSTSRHPTIFWWSFRIWRTVDTGRYINFHAPTKESIAYNYWSPKILKTSFNRRRRRLVRGPIFEKIEVASWHIHTLPHKFPSTFGWVCPCSHQNMMGEQPQWNPTLKPTPLNASQLPTLYYLELLAMVQECPVPQSDGFRCRILAFTTFMQGR